MTKNKIYGTGDSFNQNDFVIDNREGTKSCQNLPETFQESFYNFFGIDQGYGSRLSSTIQAVEPSNIQLIFLQKT